jgi:hypothetical protein
MNVSLASCKPGPCREPLLSLSEPDKVERFGQKKKKKRKLK